MATRKPETELKRLESELDQGGAGDFSADFMSVDALHRLIQKHPEAVRETTISILQKVLEAPQHNAQTQSYFLYRSAADTLTTIVSFNTASARAASAIDSLKQIIGKKPGNQHRAAAEALGALSVRISGPKPKPESGAVCPAVDWRRLLGISKAMDAGNPEVFGRSIVLELGNGKEILVVKLASDDASGKALRNEAEWMSHFHRQRYEMDVPFHIPWPLTIDKSPLFKLRDIPVKPIKRNGTVFKDGCFGIGFVASKNYFSYPNSGSNGVGLTHEAFRETILQNAWLLGRLASLGIVHTAPIPLFHNRIQRNRRQDLGLYEWPRGGRLDRWLDSCQYPNFGLTGIRDFEHFTTFPNPCNNLYQWAGTHLLSLLLVCGSYFRNKDVDQRGMDAHGNPVDARGLFDKTLLEELIQGIFDQYYNGFTGTLFAEALPVDKAHLADRMINEMGIDRYMEEILRVADQTEMSETVFRQLLRDTGFSAAELEDIKKGDGDLVLYTGPHLGGFNDRISLPEMIHFLETASALCVAGRYEVEARSD